MMCDLNYDFLGRATSTINKMKYDENLNHTDSNLQQWWKNNNYFSSLVGLSLLEVIFLYYSHL